MALKSYSGFGKKTKKKEKKKKRRMGDLFTGGITALIGVGLLSETADAVSSI